MNDGQDRLGFDEPDEPDDSVEPDVPDVPVAASAPEQASARSTRASSSQSRESSDAVGRVVRVLPDEPAIGREFDYSVPAAMVEQVRIGTIVRVPLHGRRVGGWVMADDVEPPEGVAVQPVARISGWGPPAEVLELARWAAWRWCGRTASILRTASPTVAVRGIPRPPTRPAGAPTTVVTDELAALAAEALAEPVAVVRLAPAVDVHPLLMAAAARGPILVITPRLGAARRAGVRLRRAGLPVALLPDDWSLARAGWAHVLGPRSAAWAPMPAPAAIVVLDEHDESLQQEQAPTWHARDVAIERAHRLGVPCVLVSPAPTPEALFAGRLLTQSRAAEREGWPRVDVVDRSDEPPGSGLFSDRLVDALRSEARVVCVVNRKGRSRLSCCAQCGSVAVCERCDAAVVQSADGALVCLRCDTVRPVVCTRCGGTRMRNLRAGVSRVREELEALAREPVAEITAESAIDGRGAGARVVVGTEAALHRVDRADVVAFLDLDQELLAPRYRAAEEAFGLLVAAARLVGGRAGGGRLLLQTRLPRHEVVQAALLADPTRVTDAERARRDLLGYPPSRAMAVVSGAAAPAWIERFDPPLGVEVLGPSDGRWIVRAPDHRTLCDALGAVERPPGRLRIEVDPLRL